MGLFAEYFVGVDLGQSSDPTAISILEEPSWADGDTADVLNVEAGWVWPSAINQWQLRAIIAKKLAQRPQKPPLRIPHLERLPLATSYPNVVRHVAGLLNRPPLSTSRTLLLIDYTGVGRPVFDMFVEAGLNPLGITITGGSEVHRDLVGYTVPKRDLVGAAQAVMQSGRLRIADRLRDAATLRAELIAFKIKVNIRGHDTYEAWRDKDHDDLVLATALACWYREWYSFHYDHALVSA